MNNTYIEIKEYLDKIPQKLRKEILSLEWTNKIREFGQKYSLNEDQILSLEYETLFVMIGMEPEEEFNSNLLKELRISSILANQLESDVKEKIWKPIIKKLAEVNQESKTNSFEQNSKDDIISIPLSQTTTDKINNLPQNLPTEINLEEDKNNNWFDKLVKPKPIEVEKTEILNNQKRIQTESDTKKDEFLPDLQKPKTVGFGSFVDHKLNNKTSSFVAPKEQNLQTNKTVVEYNKNDPYREPFE